MSSGFLIYAGDEPKSMPARDLGDCRDNYEKLAERVSHSSILFSVLQFLGDIPYTFLNAREKCN